MQLSRSGRNTDRQDQNDKPQRSSIDSLARCPSPVRFQQIRKPPFLTDALIWRICLMKQHIRHISANSRTQDAYDYSATAPFTYVAARRLRSSSLNGMCLPAFPVGGGEVLRGEHTQWYVGPRCKNTNTSTEGKIQNCPLHAFATLQVQAAHMVAVVHMRLCVHVQSRSQAMTRYHSVFDAGRPVDFPERIGSSYPWPASLSRSRGLSLYCCCTNISPNIAVAAAHLRPCPGTAICATVAT